MVSDRETGYLPIREVRAEIGSSNPKLEIRNPKQIRITETQMTETSGGLILLAASGYTQ